MVLFGGVIGDLKDPQLMENMAGRAMAGTGLLRNQNKRGEKTAREDTGKDEVLSRIESSRSTINVQL